MFAHPVGAGTGTDHLSGLNDAQKAAAQHGGGPLLIIAGAGTGKTKTVAARVAHLIRTGVAPERILLLTFTRRAAREMLARAAAMSADAAATRVWGGTFHATAVRLLRRHGPAIGLEPAFTIADQADAADLMGMVRSDLGLGRSGRRFPRKETLAAIYSRTVNAGRSLREVLEHDYPWCAGDIEGVRSIFRAYSDSKRAQNVLDFDDLLLYWRALVAVPGAGDALGAAFDHILVDEYQDTNSLQADILRAMRRTNDNVTVVGDDAQAIYSFRAATARNILDFPAHFPGTTIVTLEQNYRSTQPILEVSNAVMAQARERFTKVLWSTREDPCRPTLVTCTDEATQAELVSRSVLDHRELGLRLRDQAVLFRAAWHSDLVELELARRGIPFVKYGGIRFLEAAHVKDVVALLRLLENPSDELAWFRSLQLVEGVGPSSARRITAELSADGGRGTALDRFLAAPVRVRGPAAAGLEALRHALAEACASDLGPSEEIELLRRFYDAVVERAYDSAPARLRDLDQLQQIAAAAPSRARFLADLTLDPPTSTEDLAGPPGLDEDYLILSTMHSAKGCEWDAVHVIQAVDGMIPSDMALSDDDGLEEERRLFYVALTRARRSLRIYFPQRLYHRRMGTGDHHAWAQLTRFLSGPVSELVELETHLGMGSPSPAGAGTSVDDFLEDLWNQ